MAWLDTGIGGKIGKQPAAPTTTQPNYWLGDVISGSGMAPGSADAKAAQSAMENPSLPTSQSALSGLAAKYPNFNYTGNPPKTPAFPDANTWMQKALEQLGIGSLDASLKRQREQAIIDFGDPALAQMAGFGLDPQAGTFAKQNYLSGNAQLARLNKAHDKTRKAVIDRLVARGLLRSGDLGYGLSEADTAYGNDQYDARKRVLDQLNQYLQEYLDRKNALQQSVWQAYQSAYNNFLSNPGSYLGVGG